MRKVFDFTVKFSFHSFTIKFGGCSNSIKWIKMRILQNYSDFATINANKQYRKGSFWKFHQSNSQ